jgi:hypothetical protein
LYAGILASAALAALLAGCATIAPRDQPDAAALPHVSGFSENQPGEALPQGWRKWTLSRLKKPTQYRLVDEGGKTVIRASAQSSVSGLIHPLKLDPGAFPLLSWRWKVTELIPNADNTRKHTEDAPVRVAVTFDGDIDKLPFGERIFFDTVRLLTGQQLPYATLMYIWENRAPKGTVIPNLHTTRIKMIVAESGRDRVGEWQEVTRNVYQDYQRAFGEAPGTITAIGIMTDTDNTGENVHAYYGDIRFRRMPPDGLRSLATDNQ